MQIHLLTIQIGNLHPLFVHLPIGILTFAFILEVYLKIKKSEQTDIAKLALGLTAITALFSLGTGWLLGDNGGYDELALSRHKWMAVGLTVCSILLFVLRTLPHNWCKKVYVPLFLVTLALLGITGHLGGNMTHGDDFLFKEHTVSEVAIVDINKANAYKDIIQPILDSKCVSCHNANKAKGDLLLTSKASIIAGGENGSILDSINGEAASLLTRLHLPLDNKLHMPPKGKVQLTAEEISLLKWWIKNNNCFDCTVEETDASPQTKSILKTLEKDTTALGILTATAEIVPLEWISKMNANGYSVIPLAEESPLLIVTLASKNNITSKDFKYLNEYAENIVELNLAYTNFNDDLASALPKFKNLLKLQLQKTKITSAALKDIENLSLLESLNLYGTAVKSDAFEHIKKLKNLKKLYLYQTAITNTELASLKKEKPNLITKHLADTLFNNAVLNNPYIVDASDFFNDKLDLQLEHVFKSATIFYTTDGTEPDTTATKYTSPISIKESKTVKFFAHKKDWIQSDVVTANIKKSGLLLDSIWLQKKPHKNYRGDGANTLKDLKRGTINFQDGSWLAYQGENLNTTIAFNKPKKISTVSVGSLTKPTSWIFHPIGYKIWASNNNKDFKLLKSVKLPIPKKYVDDAIAFYDITFEETEAKFVKIEVENITKNPVWHPNPGGQSWVFVDEILIN